MPRADRNCGTVVRKNALLLLARIVDTHGVSIRPDDVHRVEYSIYEIDPYWPNLRTAVAGHNRVALDVERTIFDSLQIGGAWNIDCTGYNFRHVIPTARRHGFPKAGMDYELRYQFTSSHGEMHIVRFHIGHSMLEVI